MTCLLEIVCRTCLKRVQTKIDEWSQKSTTFPDEEAAALRSWCKYYVRVALILQANLINEMYN